MKKKKTQKQRQVSHWLKSLPNDLLQGELEVRVFEGAGELQLLSVYRRGDTLMVEVGNYI